MVATSALPGADLSGAIDVTGDEVAAKAISGGHGYQIKGDNSASTKPKKGS